MTIEFRPPRPGEENALRTLFTEAFGDDRFTDLFFRTAYSPDRCLAAFGSDLLAALHWFDCSCRGRRTAYVYGIAAFLRCRGQGIGSSLIRAAIDHLHGLGCGIIALVPAEESLFPYYERFGFRAVGTIREETVPAGDPIPIRPLTSAEYAAARRALLPDNGVQQEGACLDLLSGYADFYAAGDSVAAVSGRMVWELLGNPADAPGLIAALSLPAATVRSPGGDSPFAMAIGTEEPIYLGLALD